MLGIVTDNDSSLISHGALFVSKNPRRSAQFSLTRQRLFHPAWFGRPENAEAVMTDCMFYRRLIAITDKVGFQVGAFLTFL